MTGSGASLGASGGSITFAMLREDDAASGVSGGAGWFAMAARGAMEGGEACLAVDGMFC